MKPALKWMSMFTAAAGIWLALMENILRHAGYGWRTLIATFIATQGLATLLFLLLDGRLMFRAVVVTGAVGAAIVGASAIKHMLDTPHFEGFVLIIGFALIAQCLLTLGVMLRTRHARTP
jgi:hypothetical protein